VEDSEGACLVAAAHGRDVNGCDWWMSIHCGVSPLGEGNELQTISWLRNGTKSILAKIGYATALFHRRVRYCGGC
jgi:hypothetical protein